MSSKNRNNKSRTNKPRGKGSRTTKLHNANNFEQQNNIIVSRRIQKIPDSKLPSKYWYDAQYQTPCQLGGNVRSMVSSIKQGLTSIDRIADKIVVRKLDLKYNIDNADTYNLTRLMLVYLPNPSVTIGGILDTDSAYSNISPQSFTKPFCTGINFVVLWDQTHILNPNASNAAVHGEISVPCNLPVTWQYDQTFESGDIVLIWIGDSAFFPHPVLTYNMRLTFTDL